MAGITETKNRLPNEFVNNLYEMFTPGMVDNIFRGIAEKRLTTLRVNTLKYDIQSLMKYFKEINIKFERVLWYNDALIIKNANEKDIQKLAIWVVLLPGAAVKSSTFSPSLGFNTKGGTILDKLCK